MSNENFPGMGVAKDGFGGYENWRLKDGEAPLKLAIFPPMKSCAATGEWSVYFGLHFGWKGASEKDPTKSFHRPFLCLEDASFNNGVRTVNFQDGIDRLIAGKEEAKKVRQAELKASGVSDRDISADPEYKALASWLYDHSVDRKHRVLCMDQQGRFGILKITHTAMKTLRAKKKELAQEDYTMIPNVNNGAKGVWMTFSRAGQGFDTVDTIKAAMTSDTINGQRVQIIEEFQLTPELARSAMDALPDLKEHQNSARISPEQIEALAALGDSADPVEVDKIMGPKGDQGKGNDPKPAQVTAAPKEPSTATTAKRGKASASTPATSTTATTTGKTDTPPTSDIDAQIALLLKQKADAELAAVNKAAAAKAEEAGAAVEATGDFDPVDNDDDFAAIFDKKPADAAAGK